MFKIIIPVEPGNSEEDIIEICARYEIKAKKLNYLEYVLETEDALNFFWLGMNFNNKLNGE